MRGRSRLAVYQKALMKETDIDKKYSNPLKRLMLESKIKKTGVFRNPLKKVDSICSQIKHY